MAKHLDERGDPQTATHNADRTDFSARETRQAGMGARVFLVLAASLVLALVIWGALEWAQREQAGPTANHETQPAPSKLPDAEQRPSTENPQGQVPTDRDPKPQSGSGAPRESTAPDDTNR
ncbi:hypothetical protein LAC81_37580 (plasmid) [Ensifer adhaerens]|uniref:hypothetical protein n=1 Tax=Ensifer adhaerens TaxID=106592 RepID=UPI001CBFFE8E|nr:hypothetical protein [Ensifer adhaerens]MBZ7927652.1 hypothetical protein [Ensifer adhaerens]UAX98048.1 hypothetical protein LAC78_38880 [Ensifer adhaerens]UAY05429.1 hypothetical protein LAC80_37595 [Ensifer adhaerens]UAY12807.1 hypothetical protein LAC81_37580 [Ensifer adhaerens]